MNILSWNVWGLGDLSKRALIKRDFSVVGVNCMANQVCRHGYWEFCFSELIGSAIGILCCWDKTPLRLSNACQSRDLWL